MGWVYLLEAVPRDCSEVTTLRPVYFATGEDAEGPILFNGNAYTRALRAGPTFDVNALNGPGGIGGASIPGKGDLDILIGDGDARRLTSGALLDAILTYSWVDASIVVKRGEAGDAYGDYVTILSGTARHATWTPDVLTIHLRDLSERLNVPVQSATYGGTGGADGTDIAKGRLKPLRYGTTFFSEPTLLDAVTLLYQVHDPGLTNQSPTVVDVYDRGQPIDNFGDFLTTAALLAWTPIEGKYVTCNAEGMLRLAEPPAGVVTISTDFTLVKSAADIIKDVVKREGVLTDSDLDTAAFTALESVQSSTLGLVISESRTIASVLDEVCATIGALWTWTPAGLLSVKQVEFGTAVATITEDKVTDRIERVETPVPPWRVRMGYARTWRVQSPEELDATARTAELSPGVPNPGYLPNALDEYRWRDGYLVALGESPIIRAVYPLSEELLVPSLFVDSNEAGVEASRQELFLTGCIFDTLTPRHRLDIKVWGQQWTRRLGETVIVEHARLSTSGKRWVILGLREDPDTEFTALRLFGYQG